MKSTFIRFQVFLLIIFILPLRIFALNDTVSSFPFTEDWGSGSFETNHWTFPYGQGNWTISLNDGNPVPCAAFTGQPQQSNYINALESEYFDARGMNCDNMFLDFDLKLNSLINSGTEQMNIYLVVDTSIFLLSNFNNISNKAWTHYHISMHNAVNQVFKVRFNCSGSLSSDISSWQIDNISIIHHCKNPGGIGGWNEWLQYCVNHVHWSPPVCYSNNETLINLIYDDGTLEDSYRIQPNQNASLGNQFPVASTTNGVLQSFDLYFEIGYMDPGTPQSLTIQVYDASQNLIGETAPFTAAPADQWITVNAPEIPFTGMFYAMVHWNDTPGGSYYLGEDMDGPYYYYNLAYMYDGTTWSNLPNYPGVFLMRANALVSSELKNVTLDPNNPDTVTVIGYNLYRIFGDTVKVNQNLLTDTAYNDTVPVLFFYNYSASAVYSNQCESTGLVTDFGLGCPGAVNDNKKRINLRILPNPASERVEITSDKTIQSLSMINPEGVVVYCNDHCGSGKVTIEVGLYPPGLYFMTAITSSGIASEKVVISR